MVDGSPARSKRRVTSPVQMEEECQRASIIQCPRQDTNEEEDAFFGEVVIGASIFADEEKDSVPASKKLPNIENKLKEQEQQFSEQSLTSTRKNIKEHTPMKVEMKTKVETNKTIPISNLEKIECKEGDTHVCIRTGKMRVELPEERLNTKVLITLPKQFNNKLEACEESRITSRKETSHKAMAIEKKEGRRKTSLSNNVIRKPVKLQTAKMVNYSESILKQVTNEKKYIGYCTNFLSRVNSIIIS